MDGLLVDSREEQGSLRQDHPTPSSSRQALTTRPTTETPGHSLSLNRQEILDEDEYTAALSHIIARDFFPSLVPLDATNAYLDALRSGDSDLINASVRRLATLETPVHARPTQTPPDTPWGAGPADTPMRTPLQQDGRPAKRPRYDTSMSLDEFQKRYTSEDNSSFTQILDIENQLRKEKWWWAWQAQKRVEAQRHRMIEGREKLLIEGSDMGAGMKERFRIEMPTTAGLITAAADSVTSGDEEGKVMDGADEVQLQESGKQSLQVQLSKPAQTSTAEAPLDVMAPKKDMRAAGVDGWAFKARNSLMFSQDADVSPYDPKPADAKPRIILHGNTRLPEQETRTIGSSEPPSPTQSRIDAAIAGTPYHPRTELTEKFTLLPAMPSPTPSELGPAAVKQLMTWGSLNATPRILSQSSDPADQRGSAFQIATPTSREEMSRKLSIKAGKSLREKAALMSGTPSNRLRTPAGATRTSGLMGPPTWTPRRVDAVGSLTPAGRRILDRTASGVASARRADAMGKISGWESNAKAKEKDLNRVRWTPSPSPVARKAL